MATRRAFLVDGVVVDVLGGIEACVAQVQLQMLCRPEGCVERRTGMAQPVNCRVLELAALLLGTAFRLHPGQRTIEHLLHQRADMPSA